MSKRKVCIFTGTRAEYGLLKPLMEEIEKEIKRKCGLLKESSSAEEKDGKNSKDASKEK